MIQVSILKLEKFQVYLNINDFSSIVRAISKMIKEFDTIECLFESHRTNILE
jgi:hypothetical protein